MFPTINIIYQTVILYLKLGSIKCISSGFLVVKETQDKTPSMTYNLLLKLPNTFHMTSDTFFLNYDALVKHRSSHCWLLKITPLSHPVGFSWHLPFSCLLLPLSCHSSCISLLSSDSALLPDCFLFDCRPKATYPPVEYRNMLEYLSSSKKNSYSHASFYNKSICLSPRVLSDQTTLPLQRRDWTCNYDNMFTSQRYNIGLILYNLFNWWGNYHLPTSTVTAKPRKHVQA